MGLIHFILTFFKLSLCLTILLTKNLHAARRGMKSSNHGCVDCLPKLGIGNILMSLANAMEDELSMVDQYKSLRQIIILLFEECVEPKVYIPQQRFYAPCKMFLYETYEAKVNELWRITAHYKYVINMTILTAYVHFTDTCDPHYIKLLSRNHTTSSGRKYCGHVMSESLYTFDKFGTVLLQSTQHYQYHKPMLKLAYEIMHKGAAYAYSTMHSNFYYPKSWMFKTAKEPCWILLRQKILRYAWYLINYAGYNNHVHYGNLVSENTVPRTNKALSVSVLFIKCSTANASLSSYAGLVTPAMIDQGIEPVTHVTCQDGKRYNTTLSFHWYGTALLEALDTATGLAIEIKLSYVNIARAPKERFHGRSAPHLSITTYDRLSYIVFHSFEYTGFLYNIPLQHSYVGLLGKFDHAVSHIW